jgi:hypothetical protein
MTSEQASTDSGAEQPLVRKDSTSRWGIRFGWSTADNRGRRLELLWYPSIDWPEADDQAALVVLTFILTRSDESWIEEVAMEIADREIISARHANLSQDSAGGGTDEAIVPMSPERCREIAGKLVGDLPRR